METSLVDKANKPHWLHAKLLQHYDDENVCTSPLYKMFEMHPTGTMLKDINGNFWIRRAKAAHRFITMDDQENYYMQKYLLNVLLSPNDDVIINPPLSWIQVAMNANLVDQHDDVKASLFVWWPRGVTPKR